MLFRSAIDWSFLRSARFWMLTGLLFFQNAAEQSVNGWMAQGLGEVMGTLLTNFVANPVSAIMRGVLRSFGPASGGIALGRPYSLRPAVCAILNTKMELSVETGGRHEISAAVRRPSP